MSSLRTSMTVLAAVILTLAMGAGTVLAGDSRDSRNAENSFTKWVTSEPAVAPVLKNMAGFVGGDVGAGTFTGEVLAVAVDTTATPATKTIDAAYHFSGADHSFTALVHVVQTGLTDGSTAVITGQVIEGWLKDNLVAGEYTQIACTEAPNGMCFQGTLDVLRGTK